MNNSKWDPNRFKNKPKDRQFEVSRDRRAAGALTILVVILAFAWSLLFVYGVALIIRKF